MLKKTLKPLVNIVDSMADYFIYIVILFYSLYIGLYLGLADSKYEKYLVPLKTGIRIFIGSFLLLHFNPISYKTTLNKTDIRIIGSSASVILFDALFSTYTSLNTLYRAESKEMEGFSTRKKKKKREKEEADAKFKKRNEGGFGTYVMYVVMGLMIIIAMASIFLANK